MFQHHALVLTCSYTVVNEYSLQALSLTIKCLESSHQIVRICIVWTLQLLHQILT